MAENKQKPKQKFIVQVEGIAPFVAQYEVWAEDEEKAAEIFETQPWTLKLRDRPFIDLPRMRRKKLSVKNLLTGMINLVRNF